MLIDYQVDMLDIFPLVTHTEYLRALLVNVMLELPLRKLQPLTW